MATMDRNYFSQTGQRGQLVLLFGIPGQWKPAGREDAGWLRLPSLKRHKEVKSGLNAEICRTRSRLAKTLGLAFLGVTLSPGRNSVWSRRGAQQFGSSSNLQDAMHQSSPQSTLDRPSAQKLFAASNGPRTTAPVPLPWVFEDDSMFVQPVLPVTAEISLSVGGTLSSKDSGIALIRGAQGGTVMKGHEASSPGPANEPAAGPSHPGEEKARA
ncbi:conserved hypothetical protein [Histoplasma capsulatum H143]|uniref:Uncharacterized protein n=1 Tax=Ajellomyces capsulatus (strain H143) TaxID=544712 RepID=C6HIB6_AJECH|nr:conserved hypothetical protein [Histoplasma capsulatum H143]